MNNYPWDLIRAFLAVAEHGSVSRAAQEMGISQPTLSRQIRELEARTRLSLFERSTTGLRPTEQGAALIDSAARMNDAADRFSRQVSGLSLELEGDVRISANETVGYHLLPPAIAAFRQRHPKVHVELAITNRASSLGKREADVALRMFRPVQPDLVARRLPDLELGFYAHEQYLEANGTPSSVEELPDHTMIGFDDDSTFISTAAEMGLELTRNHFPLRTDHMPAQLALMRAGAGIGATHAGIARHYPELRRLLPDIELPRLEFWVVCHGDVQFNARIRALMQFLYEWFAEEPYRRVLP